MPEPGEKPKQQEIRRGFILLHVFIQVFKFGLKIYRGKIIPQGLWCFVDIIVVSWSAPLLHLLLTRTLKLCIPIKRHLNNSIKQCHYLEISKVMSCSYSDLDI